MCLWYCTSLVGGWLVNFIFIFWCEMGWAGLGGVNEWRDVFDFIQST